MAASFDKSLLERLAAGKKTSSGMASPAASELTLVRSRESSLDWTIGDEKKNTTSIDIEDVDVDEHGGSSGYSSYSEMQRTKQKARSARRRSPSLEPGALARYTRHIRSRAGVLTIAVAGLLLVASHFLHSHHRGTFSRIETPIRHIPYFSDKYDNGEAANGAWPLSTQHGPPSELCDICDCHAQPSFYGPKPEFSPWYPPRPRIQDVYPNEDTIDRNEYMRQTILDIYCARQHMTTAQSTKLVRRAGTHFEEMVAWNISGLEIGKRTIYLTTATSPNGKADVLRPQYFRRHGRSIRTWMAQQEELAKAKATHPEWQVVWVIAEDEVDIDPQVVRTLQRTGVSFVYYAYGLTRSWGNAQKNANMQVVHALSRPLDHGGILGHGPVYGLDDDNKILPELLSYLIKVDRLGVMPVGNLGADGFEAPIVNDLGEVVDSESLWMFRRFPFDFGGFSFNSSLLGTSISGPMFWKHQDFAGESEFFEQIVTNIKELEPLCGRQQEQECHVLWHNEPLVELEQLTDNEELAYVEKFGADKWFEELQRQLQEREVTRADWYEPPMGDWELVEEVFEEEDLGDNQEHDADPNEDASTSSSSSSSGSGSSSSSSSSLKTTRSEESSDSSEETSVESDEKS